MGWHYGCNPIYSVFISLARISPAFFFAVSVVCLTACSALAVPANAPTTAPVNAPITAPANAPTATPVNAPTSAPTSAPAKGRRPQADMVTLKFPADKTLGRLYKVKVGGGDIYDLQTLVQARGQVLIPKGIKMRLELSYAGVEDVSPILAIPEGMVVSLDARHLDNLTDEALCRLVRMPGLLQLLLRDTDITEKCIPVISQMKNVTELDLSELSINGKGFASLNKLTTLRKLNISDSALGDAAVHGLTPLKNLAYLQLSRASITDESIDTLSKLTALQYLIISQNTITDAGVAHLVPLQKLVYLDLSETKVTIGCLPYLKQLKGLKALILSGCKFSKADVLAITQALPHCRTRMSLPPRVDMSVFQPLH